jgi:hypothetical protein
VVTAVTVPNLGERPKKVLVTLQCSTHGCHLKYPVVKPEDELTEEETRAWRNR